MPLDERPGVDYSQQSVPFVILCVCVCVGDGRRGRHCGLLVVQFVFFRPPAYIGERRNMQSSCDVCPSVILS